MHIDRSPLPLTIGLAGPEDRLTLERLWLMFRHDMSAYTGTLPSRDGGFRSERLESALTDSTWGAWLAITGDHPVGFAIARALDQEVRVLNSLFVVRAARGRGVGDDVVRRVATAHPGRWSVAYQDANRAAGRFWPRVAASFDAHWSRERRVVPDRPDLPPDIWVSFHVDGPDRQERQLTEETMSRSASSPV